MKISLIGDSLTAGNLGIPYTEYLKLPEKAVVRNHGSDGDTAAGVRSRLDNVLRADNPDVLVLQVGANDFLIPEMASRGGSWTAFVNEMITRGSLPSPKIDDFSGIYAGLVEAASSRGVGRTVCVTIPPTGEDLSSGRNRIRREYNRSIIEIATAAGTAGVRIADVAAGFEAELTELKTSDWFFGDPEDFITDIRKVRRARGAMGLAEERGLYLTVDGAHLNEKGAELMGGIISRAILA